MDVEDGWKCECDVQLSFAGHSMEAVVAGIGTPPDGFEFEDLSERGWGPSLVREVAWAGDRRELSGLIVQFLEPLSGSIRRLHESSGASPHLRLGIYHASFDFTLRLDPSALRLIGELGADLEASIYQCSPESYE